MQIQNRKAKIGILTGGASSEKEISLESGRHVYNSLDDERYEKIPIFVDQNLRIWKIEEGLLWMNTCADIEAGLKTSGKRIDYEDLKDYIDFAFSTLHGKYGEDCFPGLFKLLDIPNNTAGVLGGSIGMDKFFQRKILKAVGLLVPKHVGVERNKWNGRTLDRIEKETGYPCIVKPSREGCSMGITKVNRRDEFKKAFGAAFEYDNLILAEEYLAGKEITTVVWGDENPEALTPTETPYKGDFLSVEEKFLPGDATMITPPNLPKEAVKKIQADSILTYQSLSLRSMARIDGIWKDGQFYILEPNTPPGMTPSTCIFHQAAEIGMNAREFFDRVIQEQINR